MTSARGLAIGRGADARVSAHFRCTRDAFDATTNPEGHVNLGTAENDLLWDMLAPRLASVPVLPEKLTHYQELFGMGTLRVALASYLGTLLRVAIDPEAIVVAAGTSVAVEMAAYALCDPGDAVLVPAPYFQGFDVIFGSRADIRLVPVAAGADFRLTSEALATAVAGATRVKALLLASPNNPLGRLYTPAELDLALAFAAEHDLDVVVDEIYAGSVYGPQPFTSLLSRAGARSDRVHVIYGFAKDFAVSGFKIGVLVGGNPAVVAAARALSQFSPVSSLAQHTLHHLITDPEWVAAYRTENHVRLRANLHVVAATLKVINAPLLPPDAGMVVWADFRAHLKAPTFAAEWALHEHLMDSARLNVSPGATYHAPEPGWFRLCFARKPDALDVAMKRLQAALT